MCKCAEYVALIVIIGGAFVFGLWTPVWLPYHRHGSVPVWGWTLAGSLTFAAVLVIAGWTAFKTWDSWMLKNRQNVASQNV
jgi:hypothetical protein